MNAPELGTLAAHFAERYPGIDADALRGILEVTTLRTYERGDVVFREHEPGNDLFLLLEGRVRITKKDVRGEQQRIAQMLAPTIVGHMTLIDNSPRNVTCAAREHTVVAILDKLAYKGLFDSVGARGSTLRHLLLAAMTEQLAEANARIRTLIDTANNTPLEDDVTESGINAASAALDGWVATEPPKRPGKSG
jgi:CRP-like cAMP-binding protein